MQKYYLFNSELKEINETLINGEGIYEVIRVIDGIPLFVEDHLNRFFNSGKIAGIQIGYNPENIEQLILQLTNANEISEGNIMLTYKTCLKAWFIPHSYPTPKMYSEGVVCGLLVAGRTNPNAKVFYSDLRQKANEMISKGGYYEVLLVDQGSKITEGSRSNLFFVSGNGLVTAPASDVLPGITRQKTLLLADLQGIKTHERSLYVQDLGGYEGAFLTGTSPKILPIQRIGKTSYNPFNPITDKLISEYNNLIQTYIALKKTI